MANRLSRPVVRNKEELYKELLRKRGVNHIDHYPTPILNHPEAEDIEDIEIISHVWKQGDRYSKLAHKHYGDARFWWVLAWFNQLPTESHIDYGDVIQIPTPLEDILEILEG